MCVFVRDVRDVVRAVAVAVARQGLVCVCVRDVRDVRDVVAVASAVAVAVSC